MHTQKETLLMKTETQRRYDAIENDGYYTLENGTRLETDEICVYGIENQPHVHETDPMCCEIGSMLVVSVAASIRITPACLGHEHLCNHRP